MGVYGARRLNFLLILILLNIGGYLLWLESLALYNYLIIGRPFIHNMWAGLVEYFLNFYFLNYFLGGLAIGITFILNHFSKNKLILVVYLYTYLNNSHPSLKLRLTFGEWAPTVNTNFINTLVYWHPIILFLCFTLVSYLVVVFKNFKFLKSAVWPYFLKNLFLIQLFYFLTFFLGSWWAAQELNWGLWWNWDIVELNLVLLCLWILALLHIYHQTAMSFYTLEILLLASLIINAQYFWVTKIDLFSSIHNFNNVFFLQKWFCVLLVSYLVLSIHTLYTIYLYKFFSNLVIFYFGILSLLNMYTYYYIYLLWDLNFVFLETFEFIKYILNYTVYYCILLNLTPQLFHPFGVFFFNFFFLIFFQLSLFFWGGTNNFFLTTHAPVLLLLFVYLFIFKITLYPALLTFVPSNSGINVYKSTYLFFSNAFSWVWDNYFNLQETNYGIFTKYNILQKNLLFCINNTVFYFLGFFNYIHEFLQIELYVNVFWQITFIFIGSGLVLFYQFYYFLRFFRSDII